MNPLGFVRGELDRLEAASLRRDVRALSTGPGPEVERDGRRLLLLASNDYLGLSADPRVIAAARDAAERWGAGAGSARLISGGLELHDALEAAFAGLKRTEDALLFSSGYLANLGTIAALTGPHDVILSDELNHASIVDAARLSRASVAVYRHADPDHLRRLLAGHRDAERILVVTDTVFSMDGDVAPLGDIADACAAAGAILMVDEAHATGVVGPGGRGAVAAAGVADGVHVVMGTLGKALGAAGACVGGSRDLIAFLRNRARTFVFDTAPAPAVAGAALAAIEILGAEPERPVRARALARTLANGLRAAGYEVPDPAAAIVPVRAGTPEAALALSASLLDAGVLVPAIRPPSVPPGTARLRATVTATHTDDQIGRAVNAFAAARVPA